MSNNRERSSSDGPPDPPERAADREQREVWDQFAKYAQYTAPTMLALLLSTRVASASPVPSDIRLKRDITLVGRSANGLNLYCYRYLWSDTSYVGVMAQEVAAFDRAAVMCGADGYLRVDYPRLGLRLQTWDDWVAAA